MAWADKGLSMSNSTMAFCLNTSTSMSLPHWALTT
eukprot:CAMPEP_0177417380 /NCGR_PEP_ID=MMETSP0368-20130122/68613_1 /TAXON_ID=447022 ORGANISM="Scrippsiella hangoei-like, Strain SHHI-4" /NCGR_SAMPLE_ID=MMETSP0368 /ASSEMBLY_ACC=CAM_ASM_000363 /LENGTH=34 /DNA_ID= /DNA_START= /DNA_END= /DNA_ORIENTATION=